MSSRASGQAVTQVAAQALVAHSVLVQAAAPISTSAGEDAAGQAAMLASQMADLLTSTQAPAVLPQADCKASRCTSQPCQVLGA